MRTKSAVKRNFERLSSILKTLQKFTVVAYNSFKTLLHPIQKLAMILVDET